MRIKSSGENFSKIFWKIASSHFWYGIDLTVASVLYAKAFTRVEAEWEPLPYADARKKRNAYAFNVNVRKSLSRM